MTYANEIQNANGNLIGRLTAAFLTWRAERRETAAKYRIYRRTFTELNALSPRDMADIGLYHHDIEAIAHEAAFGK